MTKGMRWLTAVAGLALVAGAPTGIGGVAAARTTAKAKSTHTVRAQVVRRRILRRRAAVVAPVPVVPPAVLVPAPPVPAPGDLANYRWLDDAEAMLDAIGRSAPDSRFDDGGATRDAWMLNDGSIIIADRLNAADTRLFFYAPDSTVPFLVKDRYYSYGFDRGTLAVAYDEGGRLDALRPGDWRFRAADELYARGRQLWYALRTRPAVGSAPPVSVWLDIGARPRWRDNDDWQAYRRGAGHDRRRVRDDRVQREREARADRGRPGDRHQPQRAAPAAARPVPAMPADTAPVAEAPRPRIPPGQPGAFERSVTEPGDERPRRRQDQPAPAGDPPTRARDSERSAPQVASPDAPPRPEPVVEAPRPQAAPRAEPPAPAPTPPQAAPPPTPAEPPHEQRHTEDERPQM